jgi:hypothetical protein
MVKHYNLDNRKAFRFNPYTIHYSILPLPVVHITQNQTSLETTDLRFDRRGGEFRFMQLLITDSRLRFWRKLFIDNVLKKQEVKGSVVDGDGSNNVEIIEKGGNIGDNVGDDVSNLGDINSLTGSIGVTGQVRLDELTGGNRSIATTLGAKKRRINVGHTREENPGNLIRGLFL